MQLAAQPWMTPKPPSRSVAPSATSATAAAALATTLSMAVQYGRAHGALQVRRVVATRARPR
jgi:hypothetical protein